MERDIVTPERTKKMLFLQPRERGLRPAPTSSGKFKFNHFNMWVFTKGVTHEEAVRFSGFSGYNQGIDR